VNLMGDPGSMLLLLRLLSMLLSVVFDLLFRRERNLREVLPGLFGCCNVLEELLLLLSSEMLLSEL